MISEWRRSAGFLISILFAYYYTLSLQAPVWLRMETPCAAALVVHSTWEHAAQADRKFDAWLTSPMGLPQIFKPQERVSLRLCVAPASRMRRMDAQATIAIIEGWRAHP